MCVSVLGIDANTQGHSSRIPAPGQRMASEAGDRRRKVGGGCCVDARAISLSLSSLSLPLNLCGPVSVSLCCNSASRQEFGPTQQASLRTTAPLALGGIPRGAYEGDVWKVRRMFEGSIIFFGL